MLFNINVFPDLFKGMLKGVISALGIQDRAIWVHLVGHWTVYPLCIWYFAFSEEMGFIGLWISKISLEFTILAGYTLIIKMSNWEEIAEIAAKRLEIAN